MKSEAAMPMYEYRCRRCGVQFEQLRRMEDADRELECPNCGARDGEVERLLSAFATSGTSGSSGCGGSGFGFS